MVEGKGMVSPARFLIFSVCKFIIPYLKAKFKTFYLFSAC